METKVLFDYSRIDAKTERGAKLIQVLASHPAVPPEPCMIFIRFATNKATRIWTGAINVLCGKHNFGQKLQCCVWVVRDDLSGQLFVASKPDIRAPYMPNRRHDHYPADCANFHDYPLSCFIDPASEKILAGEFLPLDLESVSFSSLEMTKETPYAKFVQQAEQLGISRKHWSLFANQPHAILLDNTPSMKDVVAGDKRCIDLASDIINRIWELLKVDIDPRIVLLRGPGKDDSRPMPCRPGERKRPFIAYQNDAELHDFHSEINSQFSDDRRTHTIIITDGDKPTGKNRAKLFPGLLKAREEARAHRVTIVICNSDPKAGAWLRRLHGKPGIAVVNVTSSEKIPFERICLGAEFKASRWERIKKFFA